MSDVAGDEAAGAVRFRLKDRAAFITFDRPAARNAMTEAMYAQLEESLERAVHEADIRVVVLRGVGGSFVAGTDIRRFTRFESGEDGLAYERRIELVVAKLESLPLPTVAVVEGFAAGAGLMLATVCDLRLCTPDARFGAPIARTVGNCLSIANTARLLAHLGAARTKALLLNAGFMTAREAHAAGFVLDVAEPADIDALVAALCERLASHAPVTIAVSKESIRRVAMHGLPDDEDLIRRAYESRDLREGVEAFLAKRPARWDGS